jgi:glycosyltransferase 2 family protein
MQQTAFSCPANRRLLGCARTSPHARASELMRPLTSAPESADGVIIETPVLLEAATPARRTTWQWALMAIGVLLLAALIYQAGPRRLADHLRTLGWWAPVIFVPYAVASAFDAAGWRATFVSSRPRLALLYIVRLIGEAVNNVTPTAYLGGEPVKAYLLQRFGVPLTEATTSVILAKTALTIAQIAFVILGVAFFFVHHGITWMTIPILAAMVVGGWIVTVLLIRWQRRGLVAAVAALIGRVFPRARITARLEARAAEIDGKLLSFYEACRGDAVASVVFHLLGWIAGAAEVFAIMALIGHPVSVTEALIVEALAQPTRLLGIVVPATLGVQEAGGMLIFGLLGMPPDLGLALMLLKRVREIGFSLLGLGLLALFGRVRPSFLVMAPANRPV